MTAGSSGGAINALMGDLQILTEELDHLDVRIDRLFSSADLEIERLSSSTKSQVDAFKVSVNDLVASAATMQTKMSGAFQQLNANFVAHLNEVEQLDASRMQALAEIQVSDTNISNLAGALQAAVSTSKTALESALESANQEIVAQNSNLIQDTKLVATEVTNIGADATTELQALVSSLDALKAKAEAALASIESTVDGAVMSSEAGITSGFGTLNDSLDSSVIDVSRASDLLLNVADKLGGEYADEVEQVASVVREISQLLETIRPILELAQELA